MNPKPIANVDQINNLMFILILSILTCRRRETTSRRQENITGIYASLTITMSLHHLPIKLLEITIISAQDLPPVSKMLRTFAVAYIHPDHKLTTKVDHKGHTNPIWNYKVAFLVDDAFLKSENPVVTIEIYNVAWLRDLPVGTTHLPINNLMPPLAQKNQSSRHVALQICRPSGHLQGILKIGVHLIDNSIPDEIPGSELSISTIRNNDEEMHDQTHEENNNLIQEEREINSRIQLSPMNSTISPISHKIIKLNPSDPDLQAETKSFVASNASLFSAMRPLPSEVAVYLKNGLYSIQGAEYGSSVFEDWSLPGESEDGRMKSVNIEGRKGDQIPLTSHHKSSFAGPRE
ncbi:calcium-dependent lipid-binding (domain) family [Olea europaea subsp. europaea]|uniref:Calcium-dependent lipid-binding (Domain) family n=1 Tax=Olea europaea subsp. europaea TaxID=158383 RepID=A0A8S0SRZ6_OLEEU|nr:calcium-dependent lipid-binding (domain) family [Olea europaea subsp. europaea]